MNILIMQGVGLSEEQFAQEVAARRTKLQLTGDQHVPGCPLCSFEKLPGAPRAAALAPAGR